MRLIIKQGHTNYKAMYISIHVFAYFVFIVKMRDGQEGMIRKMERERN